MGEDAPATSRMARSAPGRVSTAVSVNSTTSPSSVASSVRFAPSPSPAAPTAKFLDRGARVLRRGDGAGPRRHLRGRHPRLVRAPVGQRRGEHGHPEVIRERRSHPGEEREREEVLRASSHLRCPVAASAVAIDPAPSPPPSPPSPLPRPPFPRRPRATRPVWPAQPNTPVHQFALVCARLRNIRWGRLDGPRRAGGSR